jgi:quercetin dioxygenase-like cupin family protein
MMIHEPFRLPPQIGQPRLLHAGQTLALVPQVVHSASTTGRQSRPSIILPQNSQEENVMNNGTTGNMSLAINI